jgi:acetyl esterase/lipase
MKTLLASAIIFSSLVLSRAEMQTAIPLWPGGAPGALGTKSNDIPTLTPYLPDVTKTTDLTRQNNGTPRQRAVSNTATRGANSLKRPSSATGAAMVICPGGAYVGLAAHEGNDYALWLNQNGVTCFVLKYRLGSSGYHYPVEFQDVTRAIRWVREHAADYKIDPNRIGIMGSSAGGHLSSMALTHFDSGDTNSPDPVERQSSRPDIGILCYPVITMGEFTHGGSRNSLLGTNRSPEMVKYLSSELQVTASTPPCFLWTTFEDRTVPMENSLMFAEALRKNRVPFDLHIYQKGGHGMGLKDKSPFANPHPWSADCLFWLKAQGWVK